jgi:MFS superfamily sulfate permease-like transporter
VATGQIPDILGVPKGSGNWFQQQWAWMTSLGNVSWPTIAYGAATIAIIYGFKFLLPKVPGAIVAVVGLLIVSAATNAPSYGVHVVGAIQGGFPPIGLPPGVTWSDVPAVAGTAFACFVIIIAQSAATSRSFAMKHGDRADVNRDIVGLAAANLAAGLSGTFVVNGSPTKTEILDGQKGRTQVANLVVVVVTLIVLLFLAGLLTDLPKAVLAGVVFVIGIDLIDIRGLVRISRQRRREFWIALVTTLTVFIVGVGAGVIVAVLLSLLDVIERQYRAREFVLGLKGRKGYTYDPAEPGAQSEAGLIVFRYDADLFYANASRFVDEVQELVDSATDPVRWIILDAASISDIDYSAGQELGGLLDYLESKHVTLVLARPDPSILRSLDTYGLRARFPEHTVYDNLDTAVRAFPAGGAAASGATGTP